MMMPLRSHTEAGSCARRRSGSAARLRSLFWTAALLTLPMTGLCAEPPPVDDWAYQLQGYSFSVDEIRQSRYDLVVMDYSRDGGPAAEFQAAEIERIRSQGPCGQRLIVSYLSIGEAEDYRFYWDPDWVDAQGNPIPGIAPDWLGPPNPDWPGNYKVRYWDSDWQALIFGNPAGPLTSYADRILSAGFDGVYLDIIDGYEYWGAAGGTGERLTAAADMIAFVRALASYARAASGRPGFLIIPQNGAGIIHPENYPYAADPEAEAARQRGLYFGAINAIGVEDLFFRGDLPENNPY